MNLLFMQSFDIIKYNFFDVVAPSIILFSILNSGLSCFISENKKKDGASPLWLNDELEFWPDSAGRFTQIATLYGELVAVSNSGQLHQWKWTDPEPYRHPDVRNNTL